MIVFMYLHAGNADGRTVQRPWSVVYAPLMIAAAVVLLAMLSMPFFVPSSQLPSARGRGSVGLSAFGVLTICAHLVLVGPPPSPLLPSVPAALLHWDAALAPLALLLLLRAATAPLFGCCPDDGDGATDAVALQAYALRAAPRILSGWLELLMGGASLALLYSRLELGYGWGWWTVAAPMIGLQVVHVVLGCATLGTLTTTQKLPSHAKDRVEWVRHREAVAVEFGLCSCCCSLVALPALCTLAAQLHAGDEPDGGGVPATTWAAAYAPYAFVLSLPLCCLVCCALLLPDDKAEAARQLAPKHDEPDEHGAVPRGGRRDAYTTLPADFASTSPTPEPSGVGEARRRAAAPRHEPSEDGAAASAPASSGDSSDGNAPLLSEAKQVRGGESADSQVSPHLL